MDGWMNCRLQQYVYHLAVHVVQAGGACTHAAGHGANIDMPREEDNRTPLHIAVNEGHEDVVAALIEAGAKV